MTDNQELIDSIRLDIADINKAVDALVAKVALAEEAGIDLEWKEGALCDEVIMDQLTLLRATVIVDL